MKDPAFLFYPNDYIGGTLGMTFEQKGAYIELLMAQFNRGHMTKDMIGQVLGQRLELWDCLSDKFKIDSDKKYYNERLEIEQEKRKSYTDSRRNNKSGNNQYTKKEVKKIAHMSSHMENINKYIYSSFYDDQISLSNNNEKYISFVKYIFGENDLSRKLSGLLSITDQLTFEQFIKLKSKAELNKVILMDVVEKIENDKKYWKGKVSLYRTLNNWIENKFVK